MPATIFVTFREVGFHCWPDAPSHLNYLKVKHRHVFHVRVECAGGEIELHELQSEARRRFLELRISAADPRNFGGQSCETLAERLGNMLADAHGRPFVVTVSEDGECGSVATVLPA